MAELTHSFRVMQGGIQVARATGPTAEREILHYAMQYRQDGPVTVQRQQRQKPPNPDGKWYWKRHAVFEQWPPAEEPEHD